jgi:hypothetical protein
MAAPRPINSSAQPTAMGFSWAATSGITSAPMENAASA